MFAISASIWAGLALGGAAADPVFPRGMRVGLEPPPAMSVSSRFPGFEDADHKAAIGLTELPLPAYEDAEKSIFGKVPPGVTVQKREMFPFRDGIGFLLTGIVELNGVKLHKWFLLARSVDGGNFDLVAFITVEVPEEARAIYTDKVVRDALASVTFRAPPLAEQAAILPFKLDDLAGFHIIQVIPAGGLIITDGPGNDITRQPYMIISAGPGRLNTPDDRARLSRDLLTSAPLNEVTISSTEAMRIGNLPGFEIRATAEDARGQPVKLVQWVRFGASGFLRIIGVGASEDWDRLFGRFRAVRDGIEAR
jgi:hypothetical protein